MAMTMASAVPIWREHTPDGGMWWPHALYRAMCLEPNLPGGMVVAIAVKSVTFYYIVVLELN